MAGGDPRRWVIVQSQAASVSAAAAKGAHASGAPMVPERHAAQEAPEDGDRKEQWQEPATGKSSKPSVPIAVGSGAMPKISDEAQTRPCSGASSGCPARAKARSRYPTQPAGPRRSKMRPSSKAAGDEEQQGLEGEGRRDIGGGPVDGRIAVPQEGPSDEGPEDREDKRDPASGGVWPKCDEQDHDDAGGEREQRQRPEGRIVQLEHPPVDARRKEQEILRSVGPPLRHQRSCT